MPSDEVLTEDHGAVRVVTLNRPSALNAISRSVGEALIAIFRETDNDPDVRALVLTATGDRAFSAGGDLKERAGGKRTQAERDMFVAALLEHRRSTPSIAAINGLAYGGGLELALTCDLAICTPEATFAIPEARRGIIASGGGLVRLPHTIGRQRALKMALTGLPIDAQTALHWGLVIDIATREDLLQRAIDEARVIASNAPLAVAASRDIIEASIDGASPWVLNRDLRHTVSASADALEGPRAFAEKREPRWVGA